MNQYIHAALLQVREKRYFKTNGICSNAEHYLNAIYEAAGLRTRCAEADVERFLRDECTNWPKFSGQHGFPVRHPDTDPSYHTQQEVRNLAADAYRNEFNGRLWDETTAYGRDRLELLDFLIERAA